MTLVVPFEEIFQSEVGLLAKHLSWQRVELGLVATVQNGFAFSSSKFSKDKGIPLIRIRDLQRSKTETLFDGSFDEAYLVNDGDILVGMDGNFTCVRWQGGQALLNQRVCRILPRTDFVDAAFLRLALQGYLSAIQKATSSTTVGHLSSNDIKRIPLPLPPLNEQKRIVAKLDKLLPKVESCKQRLEKIPTILKRFRQSVLADAVSGKLTQSHRHNVGYTALPPSGFERFELPMLPTGWSWDLLENVADSQGGNAFKSTRFIDHGKNQVLRIGNVKSGAVDLVTSPVFIKDEDANEFARYEVRENDLLISLTGTKYKRDYGFVCRVGHCDKRLFLNQRVGRLRTKASVLPGFLQMWLSSEWYRNIFFDGETGNVNQGNVGMDAIRKAPCPVPPIEEQNLIIQIIEDFLEKARLGEKAVSGAFRILDRTSSSILSKAFSGLLVEQDASDEPASVLLDRIGSNLGLNSKKSVSRKRKAEKESQSLSV
jgi:type I restriction enzyme S subunit